MLKLLLTTSVALLLGVYALTGLSYASALTYHDPSANQPSIMPITDGDSYRSSHHAFAAPVILLDVGHGGIDGGTTEAGVLERHQLSHQSKDIFTASRQRVQRHH